MAVVLGRSSRRRSSLMATSDFAPWKVEDIEAFRVACEDPEIPRWTGFLFHLTHEAARRLIDDRIASFRTGTSAAVAVVDAATDRLLGSGSLLWID